MSVTTIAWTQQTWNPVRGCSPISPGCKNCYAERTAGRFCKRGEPFHGFVQIGKNGAPGPHWTGKVELIPHMLDVPLRRKIPTTYFVNSMSDLFHEELPDEAIDRVFAVMALCPQHTFQCLTKRAKRMQEYFLGEASPYYYAATRVQKIAQEIAPDRGISPAMVMVHWPLSNVHLGVSVEDQQRKYRIDELRETPAAVRFVSFEPLLEDLGELDLRGIDQAIWGGESGPNSRPCNVEWIRRGMAQATRDGCLNFVKQLGAHVIQGGERRRKKDKKGADMSEWDHDLRVREMPVIGGRA